MISINYPRMFNRTTTNLIYDYYATLQNLKLLLLSEKGELFGDPYFGAGVKKYLYEQNDSILRDILVDDIYTAVATFMPQIKITRDDVVIESDGTRVILTLKAQNKADFETNLYNIVLLDTNV